MDGRSDFPVLHLPGPLPTRLARKPTSTTSNGAAKLKRQAEAKTLLKKLKTNDGFALETDADVAADLAPEHRVQLPPSRGRAKSAYAELGRTLVELTHDIPREPIETRGLRLTLAVLELIPEASPGYICGALRYYANTAEGAERAATDELRRAVWGATTSARLIRFKTMLASALEIVNARRAESLDEKTDTQGEPKEPQR